MEGLSCSTCASWISQLISVLVGAGTALNTGGSGADSGLAFSLGSQLWSAVCDRRWAYKEEIVFLLVCPKLK